MQRRFSRRLLAAVCTFALLLGLVPAAYAADTPVPSRNIHAQDYTAYAGKPVTSYLYANSSGGLTRVEYTGGKIIAEDYDSAYSLTASRTVPAELAVWGGFFAGSDANYFIFGQNNPSQSKSAEVIRIVKYSKDWQRQGQASVQGANTAVPFDAGSVRCAEYGGYLYIHTCHTKFTSEDGFQHQSNMTLQVRESDMTLADAFYDTWVVDWGYVSHSFNQFILVDQNQYLVTLDQSDSDSMTMGANYQAKDVNARGIMLIRYDKTGNKAGQPKFTGKGQYWCSFTNVQPFAGSSGQNHTGASIGGFAETSNGYVSAYNYDGKAGSGPRDVYLGYTSKNGLGSGAKKVSAASGATTPLLAPTGLSGGYILWNGKNGNTITDTLYYASYSDGGSIGQVQSAAAPLSDCQPISYNGKLAWYVTNNSAPTFYGLDAGGVTVLGGTDPGTAAPSQPAAPAQPTQPEQPAKPSQPSTPSQPSKPTAPAQPSAPSTTPAIPKEPLDPRNIDPNSPCIGDVLGGKTDCTHKYGDSTRWYWSGTPGTTSCTENAYSYYTCTICGAKLVNGIMYAPGHQMKNGVCTVCGANSSGEKPGTTVQEPAKTEQPSAAPPTTSTPTAPSAPTATPPATSTNIGFSDVSANHWARNDIAQCVNRGIVVGVGNNRFDPEGKVTTVQFLAMLTRTFYSDQVAAVTVPDGQPWYWANTYAAAEAGMTDGLSGVDNNPMNRYDMAQALNNTLTDFNKQASELEMSAASAKIGDWRTISQSRSAYSEAVAGCYAKGILSGMTDGTFSGAQSMTRAQACAVINRMISEIGDPENLSTPPSQPQKPAQPQQPSQPQQPAQTPKLANGAEITDENIRSIIYGLKAEYPEGRKWNNDDSHFSAPLRTTGYGCAGFGLICTDAVFGDLPVSDTHSDFDRIKVGDMLRVSNDTHTVVVLEKKADSVVVTEGNYNESIHWGREISRRELEQGNFFDECRYPA